MDLPFKVGDRLPDIRLGSMGGRSVALSEFAGRQTLVYVWASWCGCREYLGALQEFHVQLCTNYLTRKRIEDAVGFLKQALAIDPESKVIPKQIWALQHPEKFYNGPIDKEWQKEQPPVV